MAAIGTGAAMLGATLTGAMAADLADYPEPFVMDGVYDDANAFVVGDQASAADTLGAVDIAANLQFESKTAVSGESTSVSVEGGKSESVPIGKGLSNTTFFDTTLEDDDVSNLFDGEITFQGTSYDTSEQLQMETKTDPVIQSSLTSSDDDYTSNVYLEVTARDRIRFAYKFDESINLSKSSSTQPLEIDFLGDHLTITSIDSATKFTAYVGEEHYLVVDEEVTVDVSGEDKTVSLQDVSSTSAVVVVDGVSEIITNGNTQTVNGVEITVDDVFSRTERSESSANLIIGAESSESYQNGDAYLGEDKDDPNWVWNLAGLSTQGTAQTFRVENDFVYNDISDEPPEPGVCIDLPNAYVQICFDSLTVDDADYATYVFELDTSTDLNDAIAGNDSVASIYAHTSVDEGFEMVAYTEGSAASRNVTATTRAKELWLFTPSASNLFANGSSWNMSTENMHNTSTKWVGVFYKDTSDSKVKLFGEVSMNNDSTEIARINYGNTKDTNLVLQTRAYVNGSGWTSTQTLNLTLDVIGDSTNDLEDERDDLQMHWGLGAVNGSIASLGDTVSSEEADELEWGYANLTIGTKDEDHRTYYGVIIENPKGNGASDQVELKIPQDQVMANIVVKGTSTTVSSGSTAFTPQQVTPTTKLASEVSSASDFNLIVLGGPCANDLVEELFDMTCEGWAYDDGEAVLQLADNGDNVALLVAGTQADDTRRAAKALASYADYDLSGEMVMVSGSSLTDINIGEASSADAEEEVVAEETAEE